MTLVYKFKKEKLTDGTLVSRPRILVVLNGKASSIEVPALIDSGADITVIPESIAMAIGISMSGEKSKLYAYRESNDVVSSSVNITFLGKAGRQSVNLKIPVLVSLSRKGCEDEEDIVLGIGGIFDAFDITFKKSQNRIILKKTNSILSMFKLK